MSGLLVSTWTSGLLPWLAKPFPVTANRYLKMKNDSAKMIGKAQSGRRSENSASILVVLLSAIQGKVPPFLVSPL